jgi:hypothetical protein
VRKERKKDKRNGEIKNTETNKHTEELPYMSVTKITTGFHSTADTHTHTHTYHALNKPAIGKF